MTNELETMIAIEAENKRLREIIAPLNIADYYLEEPWPDGRFATLYCDYGTLRKAKEALTQPTVTTGLLDVVKAALRFEEARADWLENGNKPNFSTRKIVAAEREHRAAAQALPPDVREMVEGLR